MIVLREGVMAEGGAVLALPLEVVVVGMGGNPSLLLVSSSAISRATALLTIFVFLSSVTGL
jgi:hypothetical protein